MLQIRVKNDPEKAAKMIEQLDGIAAVNVKKETINVTLKKDVLDYSFLPTQLIQQGYQITLFREEELSLEAAFMALTKGMGAKTNGKSDEGKSQ